jgi:hypothetical protein
MIDLVPPLAAATALRNAAFCRFTSPAGGKSEAAPPLDRACRKERQGMKAVAKNNVIAILTYRSLI